MKIIINSLLLTFCLLVVCNVSKAQQEAKKAAPQELAIKVTALKPQPIKPIVPGGEFKATPAMIPSPVSATPVADRTEVPNPAAKMPVNVPVAEEKQTAPKQEQNTVPAVQHVNN